jgi:hypothetical protein
LILIYANTEMMNLLLEEVSHDFTENFVVMLIDGAGWHRPHDPKIPESTRLIQQPSHCPELNPVEHLWEELRERYLPNKAFKSLDAVEHAFCEGLRERHGDPNRVSSMTSFPYLQVSCCMAKWYQRGGRYKLGEQFAQSFDESRGKPHPRMCLPGQRSVEWTHRGSQSVPASSSYKGCRICLLIPGLPDPSACAPYRVSVHLSHQDKRSPVKRMIVPSLPYLFSCESQGL